MLPFLASGYLGALVFDWSAGAAAFTAADERGRIDYNQIRLTARTGDGHQLLTWNSLAPATHSDLGTPGQIAFDSAGNYFFCYAPSAWARVGPAGYSNTF